MEIQEYANIDGVAMVLMLDAENNAAVSMLKSTYDEMVANQEQAQSLL